MPPTVTIAIPVRNRADRLGRAVESALAQTHPADVIHISDNASTDETEAVGRAMAAAHPRVRYTRQPENIGLIANFGFLLNAAETDHFMWLAADDLIAPSYVEKTLAALMADPSLVACVSRCRFVLPDGSERLAIGTYALLADVVMNLATYLAAPHENTRIFALYRTSALRAAFTPRPFHAYDLAVAAATLLYGRHAEIPEVLLTRELTPPSDYVRSGYQSASSRFGRLFPATAVTLDLVRRAHVPLRLPILKALLHLNLHGHLEVASHYHPRYGVRARRALERHLLWRLQRSLPPR